MPYSDSALTTALIIGGSDPAQRASPHPLAELSEGLLGTRRRCWYCDLFQRGAERRESGAAQRQNWLAVLTTKPLRQQHCGVAHAVDWKQHNIGAADDPLQYPATLVDAAVMVQQSSARAPGKFAKVSELGLPSADIEQRQVR
jgi:hypothetical protein